MTPNQKVLQLIINIILLVLFVIIFSFFGYRMEYRSRTQKIHSPLSVVDSVSMPNLEPGFKPVTDTKLDPGLNFDTGLKQDTDFKEQISDEDIFSENF